MHTTHIFRFVGTLFISTVISNGVFAMGPVGGSENNESMKLLPGDQDPGDELGTAVAMFGDLIVVGAPLATESAFRSGSAYLFDRLTGEMLIELVPLDGAIDDQFGFAVAIGDGVVAVGAVHQDSLGFDVGSVYLFDSSTGDQLAQLFPTTINAQQEFGNSLAISDGVIAVGSHFENTGGFHSGAVYLFDAGRDSPAIGSFLRRLAPFDGSPGDEFGQSVGMDSGILVVGAFHDDDNGVDSGSAYLFNADQNSAGFGSELAKLLPADGNGDELFGQSVTIHNGLVAVGAPITVPGTPWGAVYTFGGDPLSLSFGMEILKIEPAQGTLVAFFGHSVSLNSGLLAIGSHFGGFNGFASGSAYLMDVATGEQLGEYLPSDGHSFGQFGFSIALDETGVFVVGSKGGVSADDWSGSAYVFGIPEFVCVADLSGEGDLNFIDVSLFLTFFGLGNPVADINGDGLYNFLDVSAFLQAFAAGCP